MTTRAMLLATAAAVALTGSANAGHFNGWYVGLEGGANWIDDTQLTPFGTVAGVVTHTDAPLGGEFDAGWAALATVGYAFHGSNFRAELEVGYRDNEGIITSTVDLTEFSVMANVLYDIPLGAKTHLSLGAGAGADNSKIEAFGESARDWTFAYQGIVGLNFAVGSRTDLFVNYRYFRAVEPEFEELVSHKFEVDTLTKHTVTVGLRFDLSPDAPPPAPPPPPPPPPPMGPKNFVIFFGFNKCNITQEADAVLSEAAAAARSGGGASVSIVGHTDSVGSNGYNQKLSECRANAAKANMVGKGIPAGAISASGRGEGQLMVQTGDGVKEPQNRRANISIR